jgi:hypothetical protein
MIRTEKLEAAVSECRLHAEVLGEALTEWGGAVFEAGSALGLTSSQRRLLDQLAYRFAKLQDTLGEKVLPGLIDLAGEPLPDSATFAEKLQRLERLGAIESAAGWRELRELRNQIAHEYLEQPALRAAAIKRFLQGVERSIAFWRQAEAFFVRYRPQRP